MSLVDTLPRPVFRRRLDAPYIARIIQGQSRSQSFSYSPIEIQFTTRAVTLGLAGRPSNRTADPTFSGQ